MTVTLTKTEVRHLSDLLHMARRQAAALRWIQDAVIVLLDATEPRGHAEADIRNMVQRGVLPAEFMALLKIAVKG